MIVDRILDRKEAAIFGYYIGGEVMRAMDCRKSADVQVHHGTGLQSRHLRLYPVCGLAGRPGKAQSYLLVLQVAWTGGGWVPWNNGAGLDGLRISDCIIWTAGEIPPFFSGVVSK